MRGKILTEALDIINSERQDQYGDPEDSFQLISSYWNVYLDIDNITTRDVAMMLALMKIAREANQKKRDNLIDACGFLALAGGMES